MIPATLKLDMTLIIADPDSYIVHKLMWLWAWSISVLTVAGDLAGEAHSYQRIRLIVRTIERGKIG